MATEVREATPPHRMQCSSETSALIEKLLHVARQATRMEVAWVSSFGDGFQVFEVLAGKAERFGLTVGRSTSLDGSYCVRALDGRLSNVVRDSTVDGVARDLAVTLDLGIGSYLGVPIPGPGAEPMGMLCCVSRSANEVLGDDDLRFVALLAGAVSALLQDDRVEGDRQRRIRDRVGRVIRQGRLQAHLQPIMGLASGAVVGAEALARFPAEPTRPDLWFAEAASVGLGGALERAAVLAALVHLPALPADTYLSINASPDLLCSGALGATLAGVAPARIVIELTEHEAVSDYGELAGALAPLRASGVRLAVDDVGAGFASFAHVLRLQPDILKMDMSITTDIDRDPARRGLARAIVSVASDIGATVVAEGVETQPELDTVAHLGIDAAQGFFLARPAAGPLPTHLPRPAAPGRSDAGRAAGSG